MTLRSSLLLPREKMARYGVRSLSLEELWMCVLGVGTRKQSVRLLAKKVVEMMHFGVLQHSTRLPAGFGAAQEARVLAVGELLQRTQRRSEIRLQSVRDVSLLCQDFAESTRERLRILYCSTDARVILQEDIAIGGVNMVTVSPREIFFPIRWHPVDSLVICHNHPSGNITPSPEDKVFTERVHAAAQLLGIWIRDHVIVSGVQAYSFREDGLLS